ncbi:PepSY domain-containing protein [Cognatiyoonia sp. IB215446]|uniref:PepSY-associated TM helix domain-containing protein n=1 Tax=Cognatiyoonia sp. IB215446 TaxID=3097355 RepID=UPI002A183228|nr:PepSY domain-containing protein [Cognatiyoonia sp. IB215446]MDX8350281.1 PepSY domain-containing protein [Cognatiyoonia sp. IB215446]
MTDATASAPDRSQTTGSAFYRLVWKWHFLASLYVLPFMAMLAITGGIYLYKPQIEEVIYADRLNVEIGTERQPYEAQLAALAAQTEITRIRSIKIEDEPGRSTLTEFDDANKIRTLAWINPYTAEVLATQPRDETAMQIVRKFHGELLLGDFGTKFVELAAHWAIVMFITGLYLWWPRGQRTVKKAFSPPSGKGRSFWRETHLFIGILAAVLVVPIIVSGLPWTDVWGGGLRAVQEQTGTASKSLRFGGDVPNSIASEGTPIPYEQVFAIARAEGLVAPYETRPPRNTEAAYWLRSASINRAEQTELIIDQYSGMVLKRHDFADNPALARVVSQGISFHQGELYGWLNLAQNTLAAILALVLSVSGFVAWWMRRPVGSLGVPAAPDASLGTGMILLVIGLSILFPLVGASLIVALILDWLIFRRVGWFQGVSKAT